jgi:hypothetical protein
MNYIHAFDHMHSAIARNTSIVIDPGAWGYPTTGDRDGVDIAHKYSPRFWNTCGDQAQAQPRLVNTIDWNQIRYMDFKLFRSSLECDLQWDVLNKHYLHLEHERVLHIVNDDHFDYDYSKFAHLFERVHSDGTPLHLDVVVKTNNLDLEQQLVDCAYECVKHIPHLSLTVSCVWGRMCYVHVYKHPCYAQGQRLVKPY